MESQSKEDLLLAVTEGNLEKVTHILSSNVYTKGFDDWFGYNLLIKALQQGHKDIIHFLLDRISKLGQVPKTNNNHTLLYYTVSLNDIDIVKKLLDKGISIYDKKDGDDIPICLAMRNKQFNIVDLLLSNSYYCNAGENKNFDDFKENFITTFFIACQRSSLNVIKDFINLGISIDSTVKSNSWLYTDFPGYTPLHFAVNNFCLEIVEYLLWEGANNLIKSSNGLTALQLAHETKEKIQVQIDKKQNESYCNSKIELDKKLENINAIIHQFKFYSDFFDFSTFDNNRALSEFHITCMRDDPVIIEQWYHSKQNGINFTHDHIIVCDSTSYNCKDPLESLFKNSVYDNTNNEIIDSLLTNASKSTNPTTVKGLSHLHIACAKNNLDLIHKFLENKISIDTKVDFKSDKFPGFSALHFAVGFGQIEVVKLLLQNGANVNSKDATESTPLHLASFHNYLELNEVKETYFDSTDEIRNWMKNCKNQVEIVKLLLDYKADVNAKNIVGATPLYYTFGNNFIKDEFKYSYMPNLIKIRCLKELNIRQKEIFDLLMSYNADVNSCTFSGSSILHNASVLMSNEYYDNLIAAYKSLLSANCNVNVKDKEGNTPLHLACEIKNCKIVSELLNHGADSNIQDKEGKTPLHLACKIENCEIVSELLNHGADANIQDEKGKTPLYLACKIKYCKVVSELLKYGADINIQDNDEQTIFCSMNFYSIENKLIFFKLGKHLKKMMTLDYDIIDEVERSYMQVYYQYLDSNDRYGEDYSDDDSEDYSDDKEEYDLNSIDDKFSMKCRQEIEKMKKVKLNSYSTLYGILHKDSNEMAKCIKNDKFTNILTSNNLNDDFPIYGEFLKLRFRKARARDDLLNPAKEALNFATKIRFPDSCSEEIFQYLTNNDLKNFTECIFTAKVPKRKLTANNIVDSGPSLKRPCL